MSSEEVEVNRLEQIEYLLQNIRRYGYHLGLYTVTELSDEALLLIKHAIEDAQSNSK